MIVKNWYITQKFWENPKYYGKFWMDWHNWIDIGSNRIPAPIYAIKDWDVVHSIHKIYWKQVKLYTSDWNNMYRYAHLDEFKKWDIIWMTWNTGNSNWIHLHISKYEVDENRYRVNRDNWYFWAIDCLDEIENFSIGTKSYWEICIELSLEQIVVLYNWDWYIKKNNKKFKIPKP